LKNPKSQIRNPKSLYLKFGVGQGPDGKWDSGVSLPLISLRPPKLYAKEGCLKEQKVIKRSNPPTLKLRRIKVL
jgi:hypothetical protein